MSSKKGKLVIGPKSDKDVNYQYENSVHSMCLRISGSNTFRYPKMEEVRDPFFVVQVFHKANDTLAIGLNIRDSNNSTTKFSFTSAERNSDKRPTSSSSYISIPIPDNNWVNVCFNLLDVANMKSLNFQSLVSFEITPTCFFHCAFSLLEPLDPILDGRDLPQFNKCNTNFSGSMRSITILVPLIISPISTPSPLSSSSGKRIITATNSSYRKASSKIPKFSPKYKKRPKERILDSRDDEEEDDGDAFSGAPTQKLTELGPSGVQVQNLPENEEEELELIYIEAMNCYYCPSNQQYYQINN